jgi:hypothetical protein
MRPAGAVTNPATIHCDPNRDYNNLSTYRVRKALMA